MNIKPLLICSLLLAMLTPAILITRPAAAASGPVNVLNGPCNNTDVAGSEAGTSPTICGDNSTTGNDPIFGTNGIVTIIVRILSLVVGFLAIVFIIVQAIKMSASGGDTQAVASARAGLIYALVALALAVMAQAIVEFVLSRIP